MPYLMYLFLCVDMTTRPRVRFQMNRTADGHSEFVLKPSFSVLALLAQLGSQQLWTAAKGMPR